MLKRIAIVEVGGSHDECILSQLIALKEANAWVVFCGTRKMYEKNSFFSQYVDEFHEVNLPGAAWGDFMTMVRLNRWFVKNKIAIVILNTAQGGHIRNLCLTASRKVKFVGIIHTIKLLKKSFTQRLISLKVNTYFVLNDTLLHYLGPTNKEVHSFYPLDYPRFKSKLTKSDDDFWVTIVGGVEFRRKDLAAFIEMAKATPAYVRFVFLGKSEPFSMEVQQFISDLNKHALLPRVTLFNDFVEEEEFDAYLQKSDVILPLIHPNTPSGEEYLVRQIPGAINIAFSYKIPLLVHEKYDDWVDFSSGAVFYNLSNFGKQFLVAMNQNEELKEDLIDQDKFMSINQNSSFVKHLFSLNS